MLRTNSAQSITLTQWDNLTKDVIQELDTNISSSYSTVTNISIPNNNAKGIFAPNGLLYIIPNNGGTRPVGTYDVTTNTYTQVLAGYAVTSFSLNATACLGSNGHIYMPGYRTSSIFKLNTTTDTVSTIGNVTQNGDMYAGCCSTREGFIIAAPHDNLAVLKIDTSDDSITTFANISGSNKYKGCMQADNGYVYCVPNDANQVLKIDPVNETAVLVGSVYTNPGGTDGKWNNFVPGLNGILYGIPNKASSILRMDTNDDTTSLIPCPTATQDNKGYGVLALDGKIYYHNDISNNDKLNYISIIDESTGSIVVTDTKYLSRPLLGPDGNLYGTNIRDNKIGKLSMTNNPDIQLKTYLATELNKN
jgi:hypothetical protein